MAVSDLTHPEVMRALAQMSREMIESLRTPRPINVLQRSGLIALLDLAASEWTDRANESERNVREETRHSGPEKLRGGG